MIPFSAARNASKGRNCFFHKKIAVQIPCQESDDDFQKLVSQLVNQSVNQSMI